MTTIDRADHHPVSRVLLAGTGVDHDQVLDLVRRALAEDLAWGPDVTTEAIIPATAHATAYVTAHAAGTVAGLGVAAAVLEMLWATGADSPLSPRDAGKFREPMMDRSGSEATAVQALIRDGDRVKPGDRLLRVSGPLQLLLTGERTLLNFVCQLSGVATETARWVQALRQASSTAEVNRPQVSVRDTRKTVPGLRVLQKYAVRCGGGINHRMGLGDAALIKDNHVAAAGSITAAYQAVRDHDPTITIEVECDTLAQVAEALSAGAGLILLDNMDAAQLRAAVKLARPYAAELEASGGLTLDQATQVAATGVDYVAVGALTHSAPALDLGLDLDPDYHQIPPRHPSKAHR